MATSFLHSENVNSYFSSIIIICATFKSSSKIFITIIFLKTTYPLISYQVHINSSKVKGKFFNTESVLF